MVGYGGIVDLDGISSSFWCHRSTVSGPGALHAFCCLQLELNPTMVFACIGYLRLSPRSCKTPSATSLCCIWNCNPIRCWHFIDHTGKSRFFDFPEAFWDNRSHYFQANHCRKVELLMTVLRQLGWRCIPMWCVIGENHESLVSLVDGMATLISRSHPNT